MAASATDYFKKVGQPGNATFLTAPGHTIGGTSFSVDATGLWPTDTGVTFAIDTTSIVNGVATRDVGSYTVWDGVVASATTITGGVLRYGTDQNYSAGSTTRVYILPTSTRENKIVDGLLISHQQDGTMITSLPLTTPKITTSINDSGGNEVIKTPATASAVNEITVTNAATGGHPSIRTTGGDTNADLLLGGKGTGSGRFSGIYDGWVDAFETWTYASATTFTCSASLAAKLQTGDKLKLTQTTVKYFYVVSVSGTTVTITGGTDYTLANAAITLPYYSHEQTPNGFPHEFAYTPTFANTTLGNGTIAGFFAMLGKTVVFRASFTMGTTSAMGTSPTVSLPVTSASYTVNTPVGVIIAVDTGVNTYPGTLYYNTTTTHLFVVHVASGTYTNGSGITSTVPFTFGSGDALTAAGTYEAA